MKIYKPLFLITALLLFNPNIIFAVDCRKVGTASEELKKVAAVFSGKVIAEERHKITDPNDGDFGGEALFIRIKVNRWWKGSGSNEVVLQTGTVYFPGATKRFAEDFNFLTKVSYLVYAYEYEGNLLTDGCQRTKELDQADADLKELGTGFLPDAIKK